MLPVNQRRKASFKPPTGGQDWVTASRVTLLIEPAYAERPVSAEAAARVGRDDRPQSVLT